MTKKSNYLNLGIISAILFISLFPIAQPQIEEETVRSSEITRNYKIISDTERIKIQQNKQIADAVTDEILLSLTYGEFFEHDWIPNLESTYQGLYILQTIDGLSQVNLDYIYNFIMSCYEPENSLFSDLYSGLLNYSASNSRTGYSEVEATSYAILSLDIIGRLSFLSEIEQDNIFNYIKGYINLNDGGFSSNGERSSSILLSYFSYSALKILDSQPLTQTEINALGYFISGMQNNDPSETLYYGGFYDNTYLNKYNIESSFYAVYLMDKLDKINELNEISLNSHIDLLYDEDLGGTYNTINPSLFFFDYPEFYSTACAELIKNKVSFMDFMNESKAIQYILSGFNYSLNSWPVLPDSSAYFLRDTYFIMKMFDSIAYFMDPTLNNTIKSGVLKYLTTINTQLGYASGFAPIIDQYGSLTSIYQKLIFLNNTGKIQEILPDQIAEIYSYIKNSIYFNGSNEAWSFKEFPGYFADNTFYRLYGLPLEILPIPLNISRYSNYGKGIHQTFNALESLKLLNLTQNFTEEYDLNLFAQEIINCQTETGDFSPFWVSGSENYRSFKIIYEAGESLKLIDKILETNYLGDINNNKLRIYLEEHITDTEEALFFNDKTENDTRYSSEMTYYVLLIDELFNLDMIGTSAYEKIASWAVQNENFPGLNSNYEIEEGVWTVLIENFIDPNFLGVMNLEKLREIYGLFFGNSPSYRTSGILNEPKFTLLDLLFSDIFSSIEFSMDPNIHVGFRTNIEIQITGITDLNFPDHNLSAKVYTLEGIGSNLINTSLHSDREKYIIEVANEFTLEHYPKFILEINNSGWLPQNFTVDCSIESHIDLTKMDDNTNFSSGIILNYEIGLYYASGGISSNHKPIEGAQFNVSVLDSERSIIYDIQMSQETSQTIDGVNWITFSINTSKITHNFYFNIDIHSIFFLSDINLLGGSKNNVTRTSNESYSIETYSLLINNTKTEIPPPSNSINYLIVGVVFLTTIGSAIGATSIVKKVSKSKKRNRNTKIKTRNNFKFGRKFKTGFQHSDASDFSDEEFNDIGSNQDFKMKIKSVKKLIATPEKFKMEFD